MLSDKLPSTARALNSVAAKNISERVNYDGTNVG